MPSVEFEPTIPAGEGPQTHALDRAATEVGTFVITLFKYVQIIINCFYM